MLKKFFLFVFYLVFSVNISGMADPIVPCDIDKGQCLAVEPDISSLSQYGDLVGFFPARESGAPLVYLIQDGHASAEVQSNIMQMVSLLTKEKNVALVCEEGDTGTVNIHGEAVLDEISKPVRSFLFRSGAVAGCEMARLVSGDFVLYGAEDPVLYERNLDQVRDVIREEIVAADLLEGVFAAIYSLQEESFSPVQWQLVSQYRSFVKGESDEAEFIALLLAVAKQRDISFVDFPVFDSLVKGEDVNNRLDDVCFQIEGAMRHVFYSLNPDSDVIDLFEAEAHFNMVSSLSSVCMLRESYYDFELFRSEFEVKTNYYCEILGLSDDEVLRERLKSIVARPAQFYVTALEREKGLVRNSLAKLELMRSQEGVGNSLVLVAGGFHTEGIADILKEEGASVAILQPRISSIDKSAVEVYKKNLLMRGSVERFLGVFKAKNDGVISAATIRAPTFLTLCKDKHRVGNFLNYIRRLDLYEPFDFDAGVEPGVKSHRFRREVYSFLEGMIKEKEDSEVLEFQGARLKARVVRNLIQSGVAQVTDDGGVWFLKPKEGVLTFLARVLEHVYGLGKGSLSAGAVERVVRQHENVHRVLWDMHMIVEKMQMSLSERPDAFTRVLRCFAAQYGYAGSDAELIEELIAVYVSEQEIRTGNDVVLAGESGERVLLRQMYPDFEELLFKAGWRASLMECLAYPVRTSVAEVDDLNAALEKVLERLNKKKALKETVVGGGYVFDFYKLKGDDVFKMLVFDYEGTPVAFAATERKGKNDILKWAFATREKFFQNTSSFKIIESYLQNRFSSLEHVRVNLNRNVFDKLNERETAVSAGTGDESDIPDVQMMELKGRLRDLHATDSYSGVIRAGGYVVVLWKRSYLDYLSGELKQADVVICSILNRKSEVLGYFSLMNAAKGGSLISAMNGKAKQLKDHALSNLIYESFTDKYPSLEITERRFNVSTVKNLHYAAAPFVYQRLKRKYPQKKDLDLLTEVVGILDDEASVFRRYWKHEVNYRVASVYLQEAGLIKDVMLSSVAVLQKHLIEKCECDAVNVYLSFKKKYNRFMAFSLTYEYLLDTYEDVGNLSLGLLQQLLIYKGTDVPHQAAKMYELHAALKEAKIDLKSRFEFLEKKYEQVEDILNVLFAELQKDIKSECLTRSGLRTLLEFLGEHSVLFPIKRDLFDADEFDGIYEKVSKGFEAPSKFDLLRGIIDVLEKEYSEVDFSITDIFTELRRRGHFLRAPIMPISEVRRLYDSAYVPLIAAGYDFKASFLENVGSNEENGPLSIGQFDALNVMRNEILSKYRLSLSRKEIVFIILVHGNCPGNLMRVYEYLDIPESEVARLIKDYEQCLESETNKWSIAKENKLCALVALHKGMKEDNTFCAFSLEELREVLTFSGLSVMRRSALSLYERMKAGGDDPESLVKSLFRRRSRVFDVFADFCEMALASGYAARVSEVSFLFRALGANTYNFVKVYEVSRFVDTYYSGSIVSVFDEALLLESNMLEAMDRVYQDLVDKIAEKKRSDKRFENLIVSEYTFENLLFYSGVSEVYYMGKPLAFYRHYSSKGIDLLAEYKDREYVSAGDAVDAFGEFIRFLESESPHYEVVPWVVEKYLCTSDEDLKFISDVYLMSEYWKKMGFDIDDEFRQLGIDYQMYKSELQPLVKKARVYGRPVDLKSQNSMQWLVEVYFAHKGYIDKRSGVFDAQDMLSDMDPLQFWFQDERAEYDMHIKSDLIGIDKVFYGYGPEGELAWDVLLLLGSGADRKTVMKMFTLKPSELDNDVFPLIEKILSEHADLELNGYLPYSKRKRNRMHHRFRRDVRVYLKKIIDNDGVYDGLDVKAIGLGINVIRQIADSGVAFTDEAGKIGFVSNRKKALQFMARVLEKVYGFKPKSLKPKDVEGAVLAHEKVHVFFSENPAAMDELLQFCAMYPEKEKLLLDFLALQYGDLARPDLLEEAVALLAGEKYLYLDNDLVLFGQRGKRFFLSDIFPEFSKYVLGEMGILQISKSIRDKSRFAILMKMYGVSYERIAKKIGINKSVEDLKLCSEGFLSFNDRELKIIGKIFGRDNCLKDEESFLGVVDSRSGDMLRQLRELKGLSRAQLGTQIGMQKARISKLEQGLLRFRDVDYEKLESGLGVEGCLRDAEIFDACFGSANNERKMKEAEAEVHRFYALRNAGALFEDHYLFRSQDEAGLNDFKSEFAEYFGVKDVFGDEKVFNRFLYLYKAKLLDFICTVKEISNEELSRSIGLSANVISQHRNGVTSIVAAEEKYEEFFGVKGILSDSELAWNYCSYDVAVFVKRLLQKKGEPILDVANRTGIDKDALVSWIAGEDKLTYHSLVKIESFFGVRGLLSARGVGAKFEHELDMKIFNKMRNEYPEKNHSLPEATGIPANRIYDYYNGILPIAQDDIKKITGHYSVNWNVSLQFSYIDFFAGKVDYIKQLYRDSFGVRYEILGTRFKGVHEDFLRADGVHSEFFMIRGYLENGDPVGYAVLYPCESGLCLSYGRPERLVRIEKIGFFDECLAHLREMASSVSYSRVNKTAQASALSWLGVVVYQNYLSEAGGDDVLRAFDYTLNFLEEVAALYFSEEEQVVSDTYFENILGKKGYPVRQMVDCRRLWLTALENDFDIEIEYSRFLDIADNRFQAFEMLCEKIWSFDWGKGVDASIVQETLYRLDSNGKMFALASILKLKNRLLDRKIDYKDIYLRHKMATKEESLAIESAAREMQEITGEIVPRKQLSYLLQYTMKHVSNVTLSSKEVDAVKDFYTASLKLHDNHVGAFGALYENYPDYGSELLISVLRKGGFRMKGLTRFANSRSYDFYFNLYKPLFEKGVRLTQVYEVNDTDEVPQITKWVQVRNKFRRTCAEMGIDSPPGLSIANLQWFYRVTEEDGGTVGHIVTRHGDFYEAYEREGFLIDLEYEKLLKDLIKKKRFAGKSIELVAFIELMEKMKELDLYSFSPRDLQAVLVWTGVVRTFVGLSNGYKVYCEYEAKGIRLDNLVEKHSNALWRPMKVFDSVVSDIEAQLPNEKIDVKRLAKTLRSIGVPLNELDKCLPYYRVIKEYPSTFEQYSVDVKKHGYFIAFWQSFKTAKKVVEDYVVKNKDAGLEPLTIKIWQTIMVGCGFYELKYADTALLYYTDIKKKYGVSLEKVFKRILRDNPNISRLDQAQLLVDYLVDKLEFEESDYTILDTIMRGFGVYDYSLFVYLRIYNYWRLRPDGIDVVAMFDSIFDGDRMDKEKTICEIAKHVKKFGYPLKGLSRYKASITIILLLKERIANDKKMTDDWVFEEEIYSDEGKNLTQNMNADSSAEAAFEDFAFRELLDVVFKKNPGPKAKMAKRAITMLIEGESFETIAIRLRLELDECMELFSFASKLFKEEAGVDFGEAIPTVSALIKKHSFRREVREFLVDMIRNEGRSFGVDCRDFGLDVDDVRQILKGGIGFVSQNAQINISDSNVLDFVARVLEVVYEFPEGSLDADRVEGIVRVHENVHLVLDQHPEFIPSMVIELEKRGVLSALCDAVRLQYGVLGDAELLIEELVANYWMEKAVYFDNQVVLMGADAKMFFLEQLVPDFNSFFMSDPKVLSAILNGVMESDFRDLYCRGIMDQTEVLGNMRIYEELTVISEYKGDWEEEMIGRILATTPAKLVFVVEKSDWSSFGAEQKDVLSSVKRLKDLYSERLCFVITGDRMPEFSRKYKSMHADEDVSVVSDPEAISGISSELDIEKFALNLESGHGEVFSFIPFIFVRDSSGRPDSLLFKENGNHSYSVNEALLSALSGRDSIAGIVSDVSRVIVSALQKAAEIRRFEIAA